MNNRIITNENDLYLIKKTIPFGELPFIQSLKNESFAITLVIFSWIIQYYIFKLNILTIILGIIHGLIINFFGNYLHMSFHTENHFFQKYKWWRELRYLHYLHHTDSTKHNFSIVFFGFDKLFGTYKKN